MLDSEPDKKLEEDGAKALRKLVDHGTESPSSLNLTSPIRCAS
jgi:hypothetical protein